MRILIISNLYPPHVLGGYEMACRNVAVGLRQQGHEVQVLASHAPMATPEDPAWVLRCLEMRAHLAVAPHNFELQRAQDFEASCSHYGNTATLLQRLRQFKPDLVYAWFVWGVGGLALLDLLEIAGVPWVFHLMDAVPTYMLNGASPLATSVYARNEASLLSGARVISMSEQILDEVRQTVGVRFEHKPVIVPGWVDARNLVQRTRHLRGGRLRMIAAGALGVHKGTDIVIESCARLLAQGHSNFELDIYGIGSAGEWQNLAFRLGVSDHVRFHGPRAQAELLNLLPEYDVFLFPTQEREPFGFAPIEAAACGCLPILTRNAGASERLVDGVHALKIDRSVDSLTSALCAVIHGEVDLGAMAQRAARLVRRELSFETCLQAIEKTLRSAARPWNRDRLNDPRLPALVYAKHELGRYLNARP